MYFGKFYRLFLILLALFFSVLILPEKSYATQKSESNNIESKKRALLLKKRKLRALKKKRAVLKERQRLEEEKKDERPHQFSLHDLNPIIRYTYTSDLNEQTDALDGSNALSLALSHTAKNRVSYFAGLSLAYETVGSSVFRPSDNDDYFKLSDLYLGAGYMPKMKKPLSLNFGGSIGVPTSDRSRFEGYKAIVSVNGTLLHLLPKIKNLTVGVTGTFDYIYNTFDFSPVTSQTQLLGRSGFAGTLVYKLPYGFRYIGVIWSNISLFADNSDLTRFGNTHTLFWTKKNTSLYVRYSNNDLPERGATDFWFVDDYRKIVSLGLVIRALKPKVFGKKKGARPFVNTSVFEEE